MDKEIFLAENEKLYNFSAANPVSFICYTVFCSAISNINCKRNYFAFTHGIYYVCVDDEIKNHNKNSTYTNTRVRISQVENRVTFLLMTKIQRQI